MIEIRSCQGTDELDACVALEIETWGYDATEIVPRKSFLLAQKIGGQVLGAFEKAGNEGPRDQGDNENATGLVGFAMSLPGIKCADGNATPYLHSHMLAVKREYRNAGIGVQLKLEQRRDALKRGILLMEWTFDPLEIKNAFLNIHRLGAICRSYRGNFYGVSSSRLQGGLPTDRLVAEWVLNSPRVCAILDKRPHEAPGVEIRINVPVSVEQWKRREEDREQALAVQAEIRTKFEQAFSQGLAAVGFQRDKQGNGIYELGYYSSDHPGF